MSEVDVTIDVPDETGGETSVEEGIEDAIDHVVDVNQAEDIGILKATVAQLAQDVAEMKSTVAYHDDLITLHDHSDLVSTVELTECEDRLAGMIQEVVPAVTEETEEESSEEEPPSTDEPPNSRKNRRSFADMYYGRS